MRPLALMLNVGYHLSRALDDVDVAVELEAKPLEDNKAACISLQQLSQTYSTHITLAEAEGTFACWPGADISCSRRILRACDAQCCASFISCVRPPGASSAASALLPELRTAG